MQDPATGGCPRTLTGHAEVVYGVAFQPGRAAARHRQQRQDGATVGLTWRQQSVGNRALSRHLRITAHATLPGT
jgi:hypothetical protein